MTALDKAQIAYEHSTVFARTRLRVSLSGLVLLVMVIGIGALIRIYRIDDPLPDIRQNDTAAIARNFAEGTMNILYPQVDWGGNSPGYVESEFPIYSYAVAMAYRMFGVHEWLGRALNIGVYALSALLLFRLSRRLFDERVAVLATLFYSFAPLGYAFTRAFQPDALMSFGMLAGIYYFWLWTETGRRPVLLLSLLAVMVAVLINPISLYLALPLLYLVYRKYGQRSLRQPILWLYAAGVLIPSVLWYAHAVQLWWSYGNTFGVFDGWVKFGLPSPSFALTWGRELLARLLLQVTTPAGLLLMLAGLMAKPRRWNFVLHWWAVAFAVAALFTALGQYALNYYQLPLVFVTAIWMACGVNFLWQTRAAWPALTRVAAVAACVSFIGFSLWQITVGDLSNGMDVSFSEWARLNFAVRVASLTEPDAPIIFARTFRGNPQLYQHRTAQGEFLESDPVDFYRSHRKGWSVDETQMTPQFIETLRQRGARYFATAFPEILERHPDTKAALDRAYTAVEITPQWVIYKLDSQPAR